MARGMNWDKCRQTTRESAWRRHNEPLGYLPSRGAPSTELEATQKQMAYIDRLRKRAGVDLVRPGYTLSRNEASAVIESYRDRLNSDNN